MANRRRSSRKKAQSNVEKSDSNIDDEEKSVADETSSDKENIHISEDTRNGFEDTETELAKHHIKPPHASDADLESSSDYCGDSSCSTDLVSHTVKADLYGTDRDPNYVDDPNLTPVKQSSQIANIDDSGTSDCQFKPKQSPSSSPVADQSIGKIITLANTPTSVQDSGSEHLNLPYVVMERVDADYSHTEVVPLKQDKRLFNEKSVSETNIAQEVATSFGGLFNSCEPRAVVVGGSDIEIYRQSYMQPNNTPGKQQFVSPEKQKFHVTPGEQHQQFHVTAGGQQFHGSPEGHQHLLHGTTRLQKPNTSGGTEQYSSTSQQQFGNIPGRQQFQGIPEQQQFHGTPGRQQFQGTPGQQQFHGTPGRQQFQGTPGQQQFHGTPGRQQFHGTPRRQQYHVGADGRQYLSPNSYRRGFTEEENIAAEQLASELVKTYGGQNSHMISEILKASAGHEDGCGFAYSGFERPTELDESNPHYSTPQMINDVLNTPQQLSAIDAEYQDNGRLKFSAPQSSSTPDEFRKGGKVSPGELHASASDNHMHAGKWSGNKYNQYVSQMHAENYESPFPVGSRNYIPKRSSSSEQQYVDRVQHGATNMRAHQNPSPQYCLDQLAIPSRQQHQYSGGRNMGVFSSPTNIHGDVGQSTKTTFVSREHMEMHLNDKLKYMVEKQGSNTSLTDIDYSSIYPSRDFIERTTTSGRPELQPEVVTRLVNKNNSFDQPANVRRHQEEARKRYFDFTEHSRPPKKRRISKYNTEDIKVPPQMPLFDDMMQKYAPACNRDEMQGPRHKYFVVNPSEVTNMAPKALVTKYIDFLIGENEQITEISKSVNPPVDIYVTEDMYFMDSLKYQNPFPSKKFIEWVASFYPCLNFFDMKFKGQHPRFPTGQTMVRADTRPTEQILEDTFYYFQREAMNIKK